MALDPQELSRRRQARAARKAQQKKKFRRMLIAVAGAVVLLTVLIILIFTFSGSSEPVPETSAPPQTSVRLVFGGDLNVTDKVVAAAGNGNDYTQAFLDVAPILSDADVTALNFEGLLYGAPYGSDSRSAPVGLAQALDAAGVDILQLANSYSLSAGLSALVTTIDNVRASGMEPLGVYADQQARTSGQGFMIVEAKGLRIAYVAFTKGMVGTSFVSGSEGLVNVLYKDHNTTYQEIDTEGINALMSRVHAQKPDYIVAMLHWGSDYNDTISTSQRSIASLLKENGVNAIIGTHPHYLHEMSYDPESDFFVAYSLGDFLGDADKAGTEYSVLLELTVTRDDSTGITQLEDYSYTPIFLSTSEDARVLRLQQAVTAYENQYIDRVSQAEYEAMLYALDRIEDRIDPDEA